MPHCPLTQWFGNDGVLGIVTIQPVDAGQWRRRNFAFILKNDDGVVNFHGGTQLDFEKVDDIILGGK